MKFGSSKSYLTFLIMLLVSVKGYSQIDSAYIEPYKENIAVKLYAANKFVSLLHENFQEENTYDPNRPVGLGLGFNAGKMGMSFSYGFNFLRNKHKGKTESFDIQYHNYGRKINFDLIGQVYKGFYNDDTGVNDIHEIHNDLKAIKVVLFVQYIFNSEKFSFSAAFNQKEKQLKSAGSFLLGAGVHYSQINSEIPGFFSDTAQSQQSNFQLGPSIGYAYTWAIGKGLYFSGSVAGGFNIGGVSGEKRIRVYPTAIPRFGMGYNYEKWNLSINYMNHLVYAYYSENHKIALSSGGIKLCLIRRFG